ncbi:MAG: hypothetical protein WA061_02610 [Microgenomates group bacterium]
MITLIQNGLIWYDYKGDEIAWNGKQYFSVCADGGFDTIEEMDKFWEDYFSSNSKENQWRTNE